MSEWWENFKNLFRPGEQVQSIYQIDTQKLLEGGINALILDIDDTLLPRNVQDISPKLFEWIVSRKEEGFRICLLSNSRHPLRVQLIAETLNLPSLHMGFKPLPFAFWKVMEIIGSKAHETAVVGDQLFMDVLGGNLLKMYTIYTQHMTPETFLPRQLMRAAERWVISHIHS